MPDVTQHKYYTLMKYVAFAQAYTHTHTHTHTHTDWGLPMEEVCMIDESDILGHGEFGEVKVGTYRETQVRLSTIAYTVQLCVCNQNSVYVTLDFPLPNPPPPIHSIVN